MPFKSCRRHECTPSNTTDLACMDFHLFQNKKSGGSRKGGIGKNKHHEKKRRVKGKKVLYKVSYCEMKQQDVHNEGEFIQVRDDWGCLRSHFVRCHSGRQWSVEINVIYRPSVLATLPEKIREVLACSFALALGLCDLKLAPSKIFDALYEGGLKVSCR